MQTIKQNLDAIHKACAKKSDVKALKQLITSHPDGGRAIKNGDFPLHTACANKPSVEMVKYLLEECPESTGERNRDMKLPIHVALQFGASLDVIKLLVEAEPDVLGVADYEITSIVFQKVWIGHKPKFTSEAPRVGLPLHFACKYLAPLQIIHYLITQYSGTNHISRRGPEKDYSHVFEMQT